MAAFTNFQSYFYLFAAESAPLYFRLYVFGFQELAALQLEVGFLAVYCTTMLMLWIRETNYSFLFYGLVVNLLKSSSFCKSIRTHTHRVGWYSSSLNSIFSGLILLVRWRSSLSSSWRLFNFDFVRIFLVSWIEVMILWTKLTFRDLTSE